MQFLEKNMSNIMLGTIIVLLLGNLGLLAYLFKRLTRTSETSETLTVFLERIAVLESTFQADIARVEKTMRDEIRASQESTTKSLVTQLGTSTDSLVKAVGEIGDGQSQRLDAVTKAINTLTQTNESRIADVRKTLAEGLQQLQTSNEKKLDSIRHTVDEQLQTTLESRITESFKLVSRHLESVQQGLGEMQNLATGVGDLKKVLTNVRTRGTWGETRLRALLEQILTPDQYSANVNIKSDTRESVEFAIRLPGSPESLDRNVWLPIDSKFPVADYERLLEASDAKAEKTLTRDFLKGIETEAKKIREKYVYPPKTTDFAIMFLPTEGLYAEVLRQPGMVTKLQTTYRIVVAGPTTLAAILNSLRMGFQTLTIQQRSSEVWEVLAAVKSEFEKFGDELNKLENQLKTPMNTIGRIHTRTRAMERSLRAVEELPSDSLETQSGLLDDASDISDKFV